MPISIAVIDDDVAIRDSLQLLLEFQSWHVRTYPCGEAFIADLSRLGAPDCIILDANLPGMNGAGVVHVIAALNIPVIGLTAWPICKAAQGMREAGAFAILTKPVTEEQLLSQMSSVLNHAVPAA